MESLEGWHAENVTARLWSATTGISARTRRDPRPTSPPARAASPRRRQAQVDGRDDVADRVADLGTVDGGAGERGNPRLLGTADVRDGHHRTGLRQLHDEATLHALYEVMGGIAWLQRSPERPCWCPADDVAGSDSATWLR